MTPQAAGNDRPPPANTMIMHHALALLALFLSAAPAAARPVLLELFTSQSCSSCPPAEALLAALKDRPDVAALEFHVDYWNALNWRDPYSSRAATNRQRRYAQSLGTDVFTPQMVIDGRASAVGSDKDAILRAIAAAQAASSAPPSLSVSPDGGGIRVSIGAGHGPATLLLAGYDAQARTAIPTGENAGATLHEVNIVRSVQPIASWSGAPIALTVARPAGQRIALMLQRDDGTVLGLAFPAE